MIAFTSVAALSKIITFLNLSPHLHEAFLYLKLMEILALYQDSNYTIINCTASEIIQIFAFMTMILSVFKKLPWKMLQTLPLNYSSRFSSSFNYLDICERENANYPDFKDL